MNIDHHIFRVDLTLIAIGLLALLLLASEIGYRLGRRFGSRMVTDAVRGQFTAVEGAEFALVGLLLAFTFSMSAGRYESRKSAIVAEANAIGTAYLRANVLPPEEGRTLQSHFREYVDQWLELSQSGRDPRRWDAASGKINDLQSRMWTIGAAACRREPTSEAASLVLSSLNDVFDRHSDSLFAFTNRLPGGVMLVLVATSLIAVGHLGFGYGMAGRRGLFTLAILCSLIVLTTVVILDFDRPRQGMFQLVPQNMIDLQQSMSRDAAKEPVSGTKGLNR